MNYPREAMSGFSKMLKAVHSAKTPEAVAAAARVRIPLRDTVRPEDQAHLAELVAKHASARRRALGSETPPPKAASLATELFQPLRASGLTARECEVLFWIAQGKRDAEIGAVLGCAPKTVGKHIEHLLAKLDSETRLAAVNTAQRWLRRSE